MRRTKQFFIGLLSLTFLLLGQAHVSAIENNTPLYNGRLRAYMWVAPNGGAWESSGRYNGSYGVAYLVLESNVSSGYWRETGSNDYVEDGGSNAHYRPGSFARVYAHSRYSRVAGVATSVY